MTTHLIYEKLFHCTSKSDRVLGIGLSCEIPACLLGIDSKCSFSIITSLIASKAALRATIEHISRKASSFLVCGGPDV